MVGKKLSVEAKYQWTDSQSVDNVKALLKTLFEQRGVKNKTELQEYLKPSENSVYSPWKLHDMDRAVKRIKNAIKSQEQITIYGDYDADGMTSTSLMYDVIHALGGKVNYFVPDRFKDGYGPNLAEYERMAQNGTQLFITVDNGVSGKDVIDPIIDKYCVDVVITDHHELPDELPQKPVAIVHPAYPDSGYPFTGLSGVGVAFKVAWALLDKMPTSELDLVAIGEIADVVPVNDENRWLITRGLQILSQAKRPGVQAILEQAGLLGRQLDSINIGFDIAPRLNAIGRIGDSKQGVALLTNRNLAEVRQLASQVEDLNFKRKAMTKDIVNDAMSKARMNDNQALIIAGENWHQGVLGPVASRILEETGKPTIVMSKNSGDSVLKGSGRSRDGFDLYQALNPHRDLMVGFGGHPQACGLSVDQAEVDQLQQAFNDEARKQGFDANVKPELIVDVTVDPELVKSEKVYELLHKIQPYGPGNTQPEIRLHNVMARDFFEMGKGHEHLKFMANGLTCVMFNCGPGFKDELLGQKLDVVGKLNLNVWRGNATVQLLVDDIKTLE